MVRGRMGTLTTLLAAALLCMLALPGMAAPGHASWSAQLVPADARAGEMAQVVVTAKVDAGWHIYSLSKSSDMGPVPTQITLAPGGALEPAGSPVQPPAKRVHDPNFGVNVEQYEGAVAFGLPVRVKVGAKGAQQASVSVHYMACSGTQCMPPMTDKASLSFTIPTGPARPERAKALTAVPAQPAGVAATAATGSEAGQVDAVARRVQEAERGGLLQFLWLSVVMGFVALLTPCVFPMVPITVSFFAKRKEQNGHGLAGAAAYSLGIVATFTGFGLLVTGLFGATGIQKFATSPYINIGLAILFVGLAANLFGFFEIALPSGLANRAQTASRRGGLAAPVLMGLAFTLTSFTCTAPFVGTLLVTAARGNTLYPLLGMLAFSAAFASPFFLLALFPQWLARMPKSGSWLTAVKALMGFLELAAALKFLSNADLVWQRGLLTRPVFLAIWAIIGLAATAYLMGWLRLPHDDADARAGWGRRTAGVGAMGVALWCLAGIGGASLGAFDPFLPPSPYPGSRAAAIATASAIPWQHDYEAALAQARAGGRPLLLNFTGVTCTNCRYMEQHVFPLPEVAREVTAGFIPVELYTDRATAGDQRNQQLEQRLAGTVALPLYVVVSPEGRAVKVFPGLTYKPAEFVSFLRDARAFTNESREVRRPRINPAGGVLPEGLRD